MPAFIRKHGKQALARLSPFRRSLLRGLGQMALHPVLASGLIVMKSVEAAGGIAGMLDARPRRSETIYRSAGS